jgi:hypothetical protein
MKAQFGSGFLSNILSPLSLCACTFLLWPREPRIIVPQVGPDHRYARSARYSQAAPPRHREHFWLLTASARNS